MNKKIFAIFIIFCCASNICAQRIEKQKISDEEAQRIILNINYANYSVAQINKYKNKYVASTERNFILDRVTKNFTDRNLINFWDSLLSTITKVELSDNEKVFMQSRAEKDRKSAYTKSFNSFGSVFVPGNNPYQFITSLIYTGTSAILNYKKTVDEIDKSNEQMLFKISKSQDEAIFEILNEMWKYSSNLVSGYNLNDLKLINTKPMKEFVDALNYSDSEKTSAWDDQKLKDTFEYFPPFWFELGRAYQNLGDFEKAEKYYNNFEILMGNKILNYDAHYVELAKNKIRFYLKDPDKNYDVIKKYLSIIEKETIPEREEIAKNRYFTAQVLFILNELTVAENILTSIIISNDTSYIEDAILLLKEVHLAMKNSDYEIAELFSQVHFGDYISALKASSNKNKVVNEKNISWYLPYKIANNYNVKAISEGKEYYPIVVSNEQIQNSDCRYFIDLKNSELKKLDDIVLVFKNKETGSEYAVSYEIKKVNEKELIAAWKALKRCGIDYVNEDSYVVMEFGKNVVNYKYVTSDIEIEKQKLANKKIDKTEYDEPIYSENLRKDISELSNLLKDVKKQRYKEKSNFNFPYKASFFRFSKNIYCIGLKSIYQSNSNQVITFDNIGCIMR